MLRSPTRRFESGQALVGTLVVMMFAFLLAGAVAVGASALLSQKSGTQNGSSRDLVVQDALAAAVAGVAGRGDGNGGGSAVCSPPTTLAATLPNGYRSVAFCSRIDNVAPSSSTFQAPQWSGSCGVVNVTANNGSRVLFWFNARGATRAYLDNRASGCSGGSSDCPVPSPSGAVWQAVVDCNLGDERGAEYLHIQSPTQSPSMVGLASYDTTGGSIYLLAAPTGVPGGPTYEEAHLWVSPDGSTDTLRYEASLF